MILLLGELIQQGPENRGSWAASRPEAEVLPRELAGVVEREPR